jgi:hypothetical protein
MTKIITCGELRYHTLAELEALFRTLQIGARLRAALTRHASFLDMETREMLWVPIITVPSAVQNS